MELGFISAHVKTLGTAMCAYNPDTREVETGRSLATQCNQAESFSFSERLRLNK